MATSSAEQPTSLAVNVARLGKQPTARTAVSNTPPPIRPLIMVLQHSAGAVPSHGDASTARSPQQRGRIDAAPSVPVNRLRHSRNSRFTALGASDGGSGAPRRCEPYAL